MVSRAFKSPCKKNVCGPCQMCGRKDSRCVHLVNFKNSQLEDFLYTRMPRISETACICNACRHKYAKKMKDPKYTPQKTRSKVRTVCFMSTFALSYKVSVSDCSVSQINFEECFTNIKCSELP